MLYETKYIAFLCAIEKKLIYHFPEFKAKVVITWKNVSIISTNLISMCTCCVWFYVLYHIGIKVPVVYITESLQHFDRYMKNRVEIKLPLLFCKHRRKIDIGNLCRNFLMSKLPPHYHPPLTGTKPVLGSNRMISYTWFHTVRT